MGNGRDGTNGMIRFWIGTALLAGSWLFGLDYFYPADPWAWLAAIAAAVLLLGRINDVLECGDSSPLFAERPELSPAVAQKQSGDESPHSKLAALVLFLPAVWFAAWPYRMAPLLIVLGLALQLLPIRKRWSTWLGQGAVTSGVILLVQALALELYAGQTMRSHGLPWPLPEGLAGIAALLGIDAVADGSTIVMHSMRQSHRLGATWELLLDPAMLLFFVGGLTMLACSGTTRRVGQAEHSPTESGQGDGGTALRLSHPTLAWQDWIGELRRLTLVILAWLPVRAGLMIAIYLHRVLRSDPDRPLHAMNHFFSPWILLLLLAVPVLLAWRFVRLRDKGPETRAEGEERFAASEPLSPLPPPPSPLRRPVAVAAALITLAVALFTAGIYWNPVGGRKGGRVMVVERHSKWEPTTKPYDTTWFAEPELFPEVTSGYNYALVYRYLGQFYEMSRLLEGEKIDDDSLAKCDVLVIKTPTERYTSAEADAVVRFVERGGGLLLVGDHTNYERSATIMNDMTRPMGFIFRDDLLFGFGNSPYDESYCPPIVPHPIVQYFPRLDFAVSCSIDPGTSRGRAALSNTGLWSMGADYHSSNFHPVPQHCPEMRYGAFIQVWAAWHGQGRAAAFTDSTIFSNFCLFQPGKAEMMLGMIEWLNHAGPLLDPRPWLFLLGLVPLVAGIWLLQWGGTGCLSASARDTGRQAALGTRQTTWLVLLAAGTCGWVLAAELVVGAHRWAMPLPEAVRPMTSVVIDRGASSVPLAEGLYPKGKETGYGMLEAWIPRLGCRTSRREGPAVFSGDALIVICPTRSVSAERRQELERYVAAGGKLLVIDSPENTSSTANSFLWPFGLVIHHDQPHKGQLTTGVKAPVVDVAQACEVAGGTTTARIDTIPVAATIRHGKGSVIAIGFGSLWNDTNMGETWSAEPNATVKARYNVLFDLLGPFLEGTPLPAAPLPPVKKDKEGKDLGPKESGPAKL
jgi:hypothetical protein